MAQTFGRYDVRTARGGYMTRFAGHGDGKAVGKEGNDVEKGIRWRIG